MVTNFIIDNNGKQVQKSKAWIDGTLQGPDALAEIIAMHLFRLGAGQAESITFASDGAPWIWDRIEWILKTAKIPSTVMIHKVLDCCHAAGQMQAALKQFGLSETMLKGLGRLHPKQIRDGEWSWVVHTQIYQVVQSTLRILHDEMNLRVVLDHSEFDAYKLTEEILKRDIPIMVGPRGFHYDRERGQIRGLVAEYANRNARNSLLRLADLQVLEEGGQQSYLIQGQSEGVDLISDRQNEFETVAAAANAPGILP